MISVIVPVYNAEKYLEESVRSILRQEGAELELILAEDASTDGSAALCERLCAEDSRVRLLKLSHGGAAAARNRGIEAARGDYICFADSDDIVEPDYLSYMKGLLEKYDADIVACGHDEPREADMKPASEADTGKKAEREADGNDTADRGISLSVTISIGAGKKAGTTAARATDTAGAEPGVRVLEGEDALKALLYQRGLMSVPWGYLSKKSLWKEIRFPEGTEAEDMGTVYRLFMAARRVVVGERVCYHYIQRSGSTIYTTAASRRKAYWRHCREMIARVRKERPACRKAAVSRHFSACAQNLSETSLGERSSFVRRTGSDLQKAAKTVLSDSEARVRNRGAALVALVSPRLLHLMLRGAYCVKKWRIGKKN